MQNHATNGTVNGAVHAEDTLDLQISDPPALLNEIARRYPSLQRIVMEYVDNPLDAAEEMFHEHGRYLHTVRIEVVIDPEERTITIRDNCRGMTRAELERIIRNVGESKKKGVSWLNGQFGFGVHAYRAAAENIVIRTKHASGPQLELAIQREQHFGIRRPWELDEAFPSDTQTGTEVVIGPIEDEWFDDVTADSIKLEIEHHFERLLARDELVVTVKEKHAPPLLCVPFDYSTVEGRDFERRLKVETKDGPCEIDVHLKVADYEVTGQRARFFSLGRRINEVGEIRSFIRKSDHKTSLWSHPNLIGYIEVNGVVQPVITRDDFKRTADRTAFYEALLTLEDELKEALDQVIKSQRDDSLNKLEDVLESVLERLARQDRLRLRTEMAPGDEPGRRVEGGGAEGGPEGGPYQDHTESSGGWEGEGEGWDGGPDKSKDGPQGGSSEGGHHTEDDPSADQGTRRRRSGFNIRFGTYPEDPITGRMRRSHFVDSTIFINKGYPDFKERMTYSRQGRHRFNDRLCAYLAMAVGVHYKDQLYERYGRQPEARDQLFDEQVEFACRLEQALRPHLPALEQELSDDFTLTETDA